MTPYYNIALEYDGRVFTCELLPENEAKEWLWRIVSRPMVQSSRVQFRRMDVIGYDSNRKIFGYPGDVDPLTGNKLSFS